MPSDSRIHITSAEPDPRPREDRPRTGREDRTDLCTPKLRAKLAGHLAEALAPAIAAIRDLEVEAVAEPLRAAVGDFQSLYDERPLTSNKGGMQFNDSLCFYLVARALAPRFVLESGSFQGHSAWLLRQALPEAEILSCDIDHSQLRHRAEGVMFHEGDWIGAELPTIDPARSLAWFDDHTDHCRRLAEAQARGFRHVLLDDNFPAENLYATGGPPIPTLAMALDPDLADGEDLVWRRRGKVYRYRFETKHTLDVASRIEKLVVLPDVTCITRYNPPSGMTYVRLKPLA
ncbi:O-methyltransferase [Algihabitans albus]|uniref:hypothetical protein n=1 Tax=Algihabitans albus TaxID=2164067 RepID=UPI000E5D4F70|nr:hypothetical protein [Algihabitans albus]